MSNDIVLRNMDDVVLAARAMKASGFFRDVQSEAQAVVKILAGQEIGAGPFASMNGVNIIQNRPSYGAELIAAAVKKSGYDYRIQKHDNTVCEIMFLDR